MEPGHASGGVWVLWRYRSLLWDFVRFDLRQHIQVSPWDSFGLWSPLCWMVTYTFVFHGLLGFSLLHNRVGLIMHCFSLVEWLRGWPFQMDYRRQQFLDQQWSSDQKIPFQSWCCPPIWFCLH